MARNKKFVLILTADAGFGHRSAANALAAAFRETHRNESTCQIVNVLDDPQTPRGLRESQADYDHLARNMPDLYKIGYKATDANAPKTIIERGMQAMLYGVMRRILMEKRPDLIVSTYPLYPAPLGAVFTLTKKFVPLVSVVTDLETVHQIWFNAYPDLIIVPTRAVRTLALAAKVPSRKIAVIGIPVHPDYS
jgi:1,2-diacylglycerol 3-beta-galactosyltransferase